MLFLYQLLTTKGQFAEAGYLFSRLLSILLKHSSRREIGEGVIRIQLFLVDSILFAFKQAAHPPLHPSYPSNLPLSKMVDDVEMREEEEEEERFLRGEDEEEEEDEEARLEMERRTNGDNRMRREDEECEEEGRTMNYEEKRKTGDRIRNREKKMKRKEEEEGGTFITYSSLALLKSRLEMILFLREKEEARMAEERRRRRDEDEERREESDLSLSTSDLIIFKKGIQLGEIDRVLQFISEQGMKLDGRKELLLSLVEIILREEDEDDAKEFLKLMECLLGRKEVRKEEGKKLEEEGRKMEEEGRKPEEGRNNERKGKDEEEERREEVREAGEMAYEKAVDGEKWVFEKLESWMKKYDEVGYLKLLCKFNHNEVSKIFVFSKKEVKIN